MEYVLEVQGLTRHFVKKGFFGGHVSTVRAADGVSFGLRPGGVFVLAGESGSGKSTIARIILGAIQPDAGKIIFEGKEVRRDRNSLKRIRMGCQMVQQDPYDSINPRMKISDIVAEPLEIHKLGDRKERERRVLEVLEEVKLKPAEEIASKNPHMLSGGQRQRVVLARALATNPKVIIADEPVSMLDVSIRAEMLELMQDLQKRRGISFVYITHDLATARHFGDQIAILYRGMIVESGPIGDVLLHPRHPYTRALIDAISEPDPDNVNRIKDVRIKDTEAADVYQGCRFQDRCPYAVDKCSEDPVLESAGGRGVACFFPLDDSE